MGSHPVVCLKFYWGYTKNILQLERVGKKLEKTEPEASGTTSAQVPWLFLIDHLPHCTEFILYMNTLLKMSLCNSLKNSRRAATARGLILP